MGIGERLKEFYESKNYTQKTFSDSVNLSKTTINNIVLGVSKPSFHIIENIAHYHEDLDLRWLILGVEKKESKVFSKAYKSLDDGEGISEANEPPPQYGGVYEVKEIYVEKKCDLTGAACAFAKVPELEKENAALRQELAALKEKEKK